MLYYRPDIDGLRAVAVVAVVLFHAGVPGFDGGYVGVDVFFVISGFLITSFLRDDLDSGRFSIVRFYERRARRILPALVAVIAVTAGVGYFMMMPAQYTDFARAAFATSLFGSNFWFWKVADDYFSPAAEFMPLLHTWSLSVEEQFYIAFPLLLALLSRWRNAAMVAVLALLTFMSFSLAVLMVEEQPAAAFYLAPMRAWELGTGALLALVMRPRPVARWLRELVAGIGIAAILAAIVLYDGDTPFPGLAALMPCLGTAAIIHAGFHGPSMVTRSLSWRPFVFVGLISYSLYLWHWPMLAFLRLQLGQIELPAATMATAILGSVVLAIVSWRFIEIPFRRRPPVGPRNVTIFRLSAVAILVLLLMATLVRESNGLPSRLPQDIHLAHASAHDNNPLRPKCYNNWPEDGLCHFPMDTSVDVEPSFLLWGDSHADAIMPGVSVAADRVGIVGIFAGKSACPPLRNIRRVRGHSGHDCVLFNEAIIEYLENHENLTTVILMARWALAAEAVRAPGEHGNPAYLLPAVAAQDEKPSVEKNFQLFRQGITDTVNTIRSLDREVILIGNIPEIGWNVPIHSMRAARWGDPLPLAPPLDEVMQRQGRADSVLSELAEQPGVHFEPIAPRLCNPVCLTHLDGRSIYFDDNHLSRFGSIQVITPLLMNSLQGPQME